MRTLLRWLGLTALVAVLLVWLYAPLREITAFYYKLFRAKRQADRFYATCPDVSKNIRYHAGTSKTLDVYRPGAGSGYPVVFYVYGGSWGSGNKELYAPAAQRLLAEGLVLVVPDYTLYPAAGYPRQTREMAAALAWTLDNIANYGGDPSRVVVVAQSAGAQIAGLAALEPRWLAEHGHSLAELRGFIGISGVYDIPIQLIHERGKRRSGQYVIDVMGGPDNVRPASPSTHVGPETLPMLLIHGDADTTVPFGMSVDLHARLQSAGVPSKLLIYPRSGHSEILFRALTERPARLMDDMLAFIRERTAAPVGRGSRTASRS